jgi:transcriptional regulator with XRE-family HTH domain
MMIDHHASVPGPQNDRGTDMAVKPSQATRIHRDQKQEIEEVRAIRRDASDLRRSVSQGSYGDPELRRFHQLAEVAGLALDISNPELAERAGLGSSFFSTVARDKRRPKLANFLRALTAMIEVADERLFDIDNLPAVSDGSVSGTAVSASRIKQDHAELLPLASSLAQLARDEIEKLNSEPPNDPDTIEKYKKRRELLEIFANGFEDIANALAAFSASPYEPVLLGKANAVVAGVGNDVTAWWTGNGAEVIDWAIRLPAFVGGVAALGWAGANMAVATTAVAALVGGKKVIDAMKDHKKAK